MNRANDFREAIGVPRMHAPHVYLLPYLDQATLFNQLDLKGASSRGQPPHTGSYDHNQPLIQQQIPVFRCPSDGSQALSPGNNYRALVAIAWNSNPRRPNSAFTEPYDRLSAANFVDGLTNTVAFSERLTGDGVWTAFDPQREFFELDDVADLSQFDEPPDTDDPFVRACSSLTDATPDHNPTQGQYWFHANYLDTWYNHAQTPNSPLPDCGSISSFYGYGVFTARSNHPGGVNVLFMDGHARFVSDSIALSVWRAIGTRNGREAVLFE